MEALNLSDRRRQPEPNGSLFKIKWETLLTWVIAAVIAYATVNARVAVLESQVNSLSQQIGELRADVKQLLRRP